MKCADPACGEQATRELLGVPMCEDYYIEALEHGAHIVTEVHAEELVAEMAKRRHRSDMATRLYAIWKEQHPKLPEAPSP